jgi:hypothetical protein
MRVNVDDDLRQGDGERPVGRAQNALSSLGARATSDLADIFLEVGQVTSNASHRAASTP